MAIPCLNLSYGNYSELEVHNFSWLYPFIYKYHCLACLLYSYCAFFSMVAAEWYKYGKSINSVYLPPK